MRTLWYGLGLIALGLGIVGIALPVVPTVPFLLLAAAAFARSSPRLERRIMNHPTYGPPVRAWRERGAISRAGKQAATLAFAVSIAITFIFTHMPWPLVTVAAAGLVGGWIWTRPEA